MAQQHTQQTHLHWLAHDHVGPGGQVLGHVMLQHIARHPHHQVAIAPFPEPANRLHAILIAETNKEIWFLRKVNAVCIKRYVYVNMTLEQQMGSMYVYFNK